MKDQLTKRVLAQGKLENGLYKFLVTKSEHSSCHNSFNSSVTAFTSMVNKEELWYYRLDHANSKIVHRILSDCNIYSTNNIIDVCSS